MKRFNYKNILVVLILVSILQSCKEDIPEVATLPIVVPTKLDENAGTWKTVLANSGTISIPTPQPTTSAEYQAELQELVNLSTNRTNEQTSRANFWAAGSVVRWNEIARDLVAKYNVAPVVGAPANPNKPFANPPFAARLYALLSVAQYDALIATWKFKYQFNRPSPSVTAPAIQLIGGSALLPSYPSEHAVVAEASRKVLEFLFPAEKDFLQAKADENSISRKWAGANTQNDLDAGKIIGASVATFAINRLKSDRMKNAPDPNKTYLAYFKINETTVPTPWKSLETPERPGMLPLYGLVKTWYDSTSVYSTQPPAPPAVGSVEFIKDLQEVRKISDDRSREQWRIADFWADGAGTYTPPGHWNKIAQELVVQSGFSEVRTARTFALMNRAVMDAGIICWFTKYKYYIPRPSQIDAKIKTATGIPNFPSYTSGHASFSSAAAVLLGHIFPDQASDLLRQADEAALSRLYGGIHYRFDNDKGKESGMKIGQLAVAWAQTDGAN
jgi:PAP2 superfamily